MSVGTGIGFEPVCGTAVIMKPVQKHTVGTFPNEIRGAGVFYLGSAWPVCHVFRGGPCIPPIAAVGVAGESIHGAIRRKQGPVG